MKSQQTSERDAKRYAKVVFVVLLGILLGLCIPMMNNVVRDSAVWSVLPPADVDENGEPLTEEQKRLRIEERVKSRGTLTSVGLAMTMGLTTSWMDGTCDVDLIRSQLFVSILLGAVVGFLLDTCMASEEGLKKYKGDPDEGSAPDAPTYSDKDFGRAVKYALAQLTTENFGRYLITVLIDLFISAVIITKLTTMTDDALAARPGDGRRLALVKSVLSSAPLSTVVPAACTALVSILTFQVYTNNTRLNWAIRGTDSTDVNTGVSTNLLMCGSAAAALFLVSPVKGLNDALKLGLVISYFLIVTGLSYRGIEETKESTDHGPGFVVFLTLLLTCTAVLFTSKGGRTPPLRAGTKGLLALAFVLYLLVPLLVAYTNKPWQPTLVTACVSTLSFVLVTFLASRSKRTQQSASLLSRSSRSPRTGR